MVFTKFYFIFFKCQPARALQFILFQNPSGGKGPSLANRQGTDRRRNKTDITLPSITWFPPLTKLSNEYGRVTFHISWKNLNCCHKGRLFCFRNEIDSPDTLILRPMSYQLMGSWSRVSVAQKALPFHILYRFIWTDWNKGLRNCW